MMEWIAGLLGAAAGGALFYLGRVSRGALRHGVSSKREEPGEREEARRHWQELSNFLSYDGSERPEPEQRKENGVG